MPSKTYSVRVPLGTPDVSSEDLAAWLEAQLASNAPLATDPGAGERFLRPSLDKERVEQAARAAGESEAVFLRRLIASKVQIPEEPERSEAEGKPKALVLKGPARLRAEQMMPAVRLYEAAQSFAIRKVLKAPEAHREAAFSEEERQLLATSGSEVLNRRAHPKVVENIDVLGLALTVVAIQLKKIEAVQAVAERKQQQERGQQPPKEQGQ